jgi:uncharacterized protein (TIRG00374 family)
VRLRSILLAVGSLSAGVLLITCLMALAKIDVREVVQKLNHMDGISFAAFTLLMALHIFLSTQKWRIIDAVVRHPDDAPLPGWMSFALSSGGIALGQLLPVAMGMAVARTIGTYVHGRAFTRGTVATVFEQGFDFLIICFLIPASIATRFWHGGPLMWTAIAIVFTAISLLGIGGCVRLLHRMCGRFAASTARFTRLKHGLVELRDSGLLNARIARKLVLLSVLRFIILVLMAFLATRAIGIEVPVWHLAAAMPFVVFSSVIAISPGALGVSELTYATALSLFGTPLPLAAQFALANRFLVASASFIIAICASGFVVLKRTLTLSESRSSEGAIQ